MFYKNGNKDAKIRFLSDLHFPWRIHVDRPDAKAFALLSASSIFGPAATYTVAPRHNK